MKKDAYYFPHFSNARHDRKIKRAMKDLGCEAYGIYFMLLEVLRDQQDFKYPLRDLDLLQDEFGTSLAKIQAVVKGYDLFQVDESNFFSLKFNLYMQPYIEKSDRARAAALIKWEKVKAIECKSNANAYANAVQMECVGNASKVKESKVKERKGKKATSDEIAYPDWFDENLKSVFKEYLTIRKKMKLSNSESVLKRLFNKLEDFTAKNKIHANEVILNSINSSWKDFYPLKDITGNEVMSEPEKIKSPEELAWEEEQKASNKKKRDEIMAKIKQNLERDKSDKPVYKKVPREESMEILNMLGD